MNEAGKRRLSKNLKISLVSLIGLCLVTICCIAQLFVEPRDREATPTPTLQSIETIILQTSDAAAIQTQNASSPTPNSTPTFLPTLTQPATLAVIDTLIPPSTILPFNPPTATTFILPTNPPPSGGGGNCNPYYPTVCINDNPRLTCPELRDKGIFQFQVLAPDPLGYDRDTDGVGCE